LALKSIQPARRRLADEVYTQLVDAIMAREIKPGDQLVQEKLAVELQISRTPVREALMRLEREGVLVVSNKGSFHLYEMSDGEVHELYQARAAVEGQAAQILAGRCTPAILAKLRHIIQREEDIKSGTARRYFEANRKIHRTFMELADNRFLLEMFDMIWGKARAFHLFATIENVDLSQSLGDHMALIDVIATGDKMKTLEAFTLHIQDGLELQIKGLHAS
jgi:DNA-binding GntR family transcriptional regulator